MALLAETIGVLVVLRITSARARVGAERGERVTASALALSGSGTSETIAEASLTSTSTVHVEPRSASAPIIRPEDGICLAAVALVVQCAETGVAGVVAGDAVRVAVVGVAGTSALAAGEGCACAAGLAVVAVRAVAGAAGEVAAEAVAVAVVAVETVVARADVAGQGGVGLAAGALVVRCTRACEAGVVAGLAVVWDTEVARSACAGEVTLDNCVVLAAQTICR